MLAFGVEKNETNAHAKQRILHQRLLDAFGPDVGGLTRKASNEGHRGAICQNSSHRIGDVSCGDGNIEKSGRAKQRMLYQGFLEAFGSIPLWHSPGWFLLRTAGDDAAYCSVISTFG